MDSFSINTDRESMRLTRANSMVSINVTEALTMAVPVSIRGGRLRQILHALPIDVMEVQLLAREFFSRCDLQDIYMSLDKCAESFGISAKIAKGIYAYIRISENLDDATYNYARKLQLQNPRSGRSSVVEDLQEWSRVYGKMNNANPSRVDKQSGLGSLPSLFLTFENFVEASVYVSPRANVQQRIDLAFSILDANCDGFVDAEEIRCLMLDSLRANLNNHKGDSSKKVVEILENEVEVLVGDLKAQYRSDQFTKEQFMEFAESAEFLNFFTVNKHWLRDILNEDYNKHSRPQDAEMRQFLESLDDEMDSEDIIDLQETLRDHIVDNVADLRSLKMKDFIKMNIDRKLARRIMGEVVKYHEENLAENDLMRIPSALPGVSPSSLRSKANNNSVMALERMQAAKTLGQRITEVVPSTPDTIFYSFISIYVLQIVLSSLTMDRESIASVISNASVHGIFLCVFMAPLSRYYPFITKRFSISPNTIASEVLLFMASSVFVRINVSFAVFHVLAHSLSRQMGITFGIGTSTFNSQSTSQIVTGYVLCLLATIYCIEWLRVKNQHRLSYQFKSTMFHFLVIVALTFHSTICISPAVSLNSVAAVRLLVALMPTLILMICTMHQRLFTVHSMEVTLVKHERPNYMMFWLKKADDFKHLCGQYVQMKYAPCSKHEYHPFYITSSPDSNFMRVSLLSTGNWSQNMFDIGCENMHIMEMEAMDILGPFGCGFSANKMEYDYDYLMVIATDEGSVEVISSLLDFVCINCLGSKSHPVKRVYCYWMCSAEDGCYWFYKLLRDLKNMYKDKFFPTIFVISSDKEQKVQSFGLNFFLALRRESLHDNLQARTAVQRLSTEKLVTFRGRKRSICALSNPMRELTGKAARRHSRFQQRNMGSLLVADDDASSGHLLAAVDRAEHHHFRESPDFEPEPDLEPRQLRLSRLSLVKKGNKKNHGFNLQFESQVGKNADDISMQSPDFKNAFSKIREQLINNQSNHIVTKGTVNQQPYSVKKQGPHCAMNAIVPALKVNHNAGRQYNVGAFFVGSDILANRLALLCRQFSDDQVEFEFNPMVIGKSYTNKYSA